MVKLTLFDLPAAFKSIIILAAKTSAHTLWFFSANCRVLYGTGTGKRIDVYYATVGPLDHNTVPLN